MSAAAQAICRQARMKGLTGRWDGPPGLGLALVSGPDSTGFLQARLTSDVLALAPGQGQLSAKLTPRGELVGYFSLHRLPDLGQPFPSFFFLAPRADLNLIIDDLAATVIGEDILMEDVSDQFEALLVQGPAADRFLEEALGQPVTDNSPEYSLQIPVGGKSALPGGDFPVDLMILSRSFTGDPGRLLLWGSGSSGSGFLKTLLAVAEGQGLTLLDEGDPAATAWNWLTVEAGWPLVGRDLESGGTLLPKTGLEQQVSSSSKGCYPGQEVVARIRTYGSVPTALRGLVFASVDLALLGELPDPGQELKVGGLKIGAWGTCAWSVTRDRWIALAYLDRDHRAPGTRLQVATKAGSTEAEVVLLPFFRAADQGERAIYLHDQAIHSFSEGNDEQAVDLLEQAVRLDPGLKDAYEALGVILGRREKYVQAIDVFRRLEEVAPDEPMVHTNLSLFYMKIGDQEEAERQKAQATLKRFAAVTDPAEAQALHKEAETARFQDARRRIGLFSEVLEFDATDPLALMGLGKALADLEQYGQAEACLARALAAQPDNSALYVARGKVLEALGRAPEAGEVYRQGVAVASRRGDLMPLKDMEHRLLMLEA